VCVYVCHSLSLCDSLCAVCVCVCVTLYMLVSVYVTLCMAVGRWLWHMLIKYWLFICAALFLGIAIKEPVIFNIVYMLLFLIFLIIFKVCVSLSLSVSVCS